MQYNCNRILSAIKYPWTHESVTNDEFQKYLFKENATKAKIHKLVLDAGCDLESLEYLNEYSCSIYSNIIRRQKNTPGVAELAENAHDIGCRNICNEVKDVLDQIDNEKPEKALESAKLLNFYMTRCMKKV